MKETRKDGRRGRRVLVQIQEPTRPMGVLMPKMPVGEAGICQEGACLSHQL